MNDYGAGKSSSFLVIEINKEFQLIRWVGMEIFHKSERSQPEELSEPMDNPTFQKPRKEVKLKVIRGPTL